MMRQGLAPWIYSIRRPQDEPGQDFPADFAGRVRYLPEEGDLFTEFRWLIRTQRLHPLLQEVALGLKGTHDYGRIQEAGWLGGQMQAAGIGHVHAHFAGLAARTAYWLQRYYGIGYSFTAHANDIFTPLDPALPVQLDELIRRAKFVVTVSDFSAAQLRARFPWATRKIYRVYNGIDTRAFPLAHPSQNPPHIVSVGPLHRKKRVRRPDCRLCHLARPGRGFPLPDRRRRPVGGRTRRRHRTARPACPRRVDRPETHARSHGPTANRPGVRAAVRRGGGRRHGQFAHGDRRSHGGRAAGGFDEPGGRAGDG